MIVLDTNVISELTRSEPVPEVLACIDSYPANEVYLTSVTAAELWCGIGLLPEGRRKARLAERVHELLSEDFAGQVLAFTVDAAIHYGDIVVSRQHQATPISMADAQIAAICRLYDASLATRNVKDFAETGVEIVDPWQAGRHDGG